MPSYTVNAKYSGVPGLTGFSATLSPEELALLLSDEAVDYFEEDQMYHMSQTCLRQSTNTWYPLLVTLHLCVLILYHPADM